MTHKILALATLGWLLSGCSLLQQTPGAEAPHTGKTIAAKAPKARVAKAEARAFGDGRMDRHVGDYFVQRFTGTFREQPLQLREEVLSRDPKVVVVAYTFDDGSNPITLNVYRNAKTDAVEKVLKIAGKAELPASTADFEALLGQTVFAADSNEGLVDAEKSTCLVGTEQVACEAKHYSVVVGEQMATMVVISSSELPGRDISGEIKAKDGNILYRSELIETGQQSAKPGVASLAAK